VFTQALPDLLIPGNPGWSRRDIGGNVSAQYFLQEDNRGLFGTAALQLQNLHYQRFGEELGLYELGVIAGVGYHIKPIPDNGLYISPGAFLVLPVYKTAQPTLDGQMFHESLSFLRLAAFVVVGWELAP
jgi:hypothetical protein